MTRRRYADLAGEGVVVRSLTDGDLMDAAGPSYAPLEGRVYPFQYDAPRRFRPLLEWEALFGDEEEDEGDPDDVVDYMEDLLDETH